MAAVPQPTQSKPAATTTTESSTLKTQAEERKLLLDEYFESTKLLEVIEGFVTNMAATFKGQLRLPANPYPELLKTIRMHELRRAFVLEGGGSSSLDLTLVSGQASTPSQFQVCSVEHEQFALPIWGMRLTLERLTGASLSCLLEQVSATLQGLLFYKEFTDDDCRTTAFSALVGDCILGTRLPALPRCFLPLETHVFVVGVHLEQTIAAFARFLLNQVHEAANAAMHFTALSPEEAADYRGCILCDGITIDFESDSAEATVWTMERLKESRAAFITAIKAALVSNSRIALKRYESAQLHSSSRFLCTVEQYFFFHFTMDDSSKPAHRKKMKSTISRRSFLVGSRAVDGVFFHAQGAVEIAARLRAEAQAAREEEERKKHSSKKTKQAAATLTQPIAEVPERKPSRPGFAGVLQETIGTLHRMGLNSEVFRQQAHTLVGCFAYALGSLVEAHEVLVEALYHPKRSATTVPVIQAGFASIKMWMKRFTEESSVCPPTSVLHPVDFFLLKLYRDVEAASALENERQMEQFVEALRGVNDLLLTVIRIAFADFLRLVRVTTMPQAAPGATRTSIDVQDEKETTATDEIDVLRALEMAVEERKYPASIVSEAVFAQAVIDSCLDVALESAVMNTVAIRLPPNPFIDMSSSLQVFALRQLVWRYELRPTARKPTTKLFKLGSLELFSIEGSSVCAVNPRLLELISGDQAINTQQWLVGHRVSFQGAYTPPKSSYSVAIIPMLIVFHPLLFAASSKSDKEQAVLQHVNTMEHYILEGAEFGQARAFFMEAVQRDLRRLAAACGSPATGARSKKHWVLGVRLEVVDSHGQVEASLGLSPSAADEGLAALIEEGAQAHLLLQASIQVAEVETNGDSDVLTIYKVTKAYAFHHHSTDAADSTTLLSPLASFQVLQYGAFFSKDDALRCLTSVQSGGCHLGGSDIPREARTPYASTAFQHDDQFLLYELDILHQTARCTTPRHRRDGELAARLIDHSDVCQLYSLVRAPHLSMPARDVRTNSRSSRVSRNTLCDGS